MGICSWVGQLYRQRLSIGDAGAAMLLGVNSFGYLVGLLLLSWFSARRQFNERILLGLSTGMATLVLMGVILNRNYYGGLALMALDGSVIAGSGPAVYSFVGGRFQAWGATAFAVLVGFSQVGCAAGPYSVGFLGEKIGSLGRAIWLVPICSFIVATISFVWEFQEKKLRKVPVLLPHHGAPTEEAPGENRY